MLIKVCDSIMGSGKTMACIHMMNNSPNKKFLFITPRLTEVDRIKENCPAFCAPFRNAKGKLSNLHKLINEGRNIVSTHKKADKFFLPI